MESCYFKIEKLTPPDPAAVLPGYQFAGFVFVEATTEDGTVYFPWPRYTDGQGNSYVVEVKDTNKAGCPYPPPCDPPLDGDCYTDE